MSPAPRVAAVRARREALLARIAEAARRAGRDPAEVELLAASKAQPPEAVRAAYDAGQRLFGENYVQEWREKAEHPLLVGLPDLRWHFIGTLQRNKVKYLAGRVACVEAVDRLELAEELSRRWSARGATVRVLVAVNLGDEESKHGFGPEELEQALPAIAALPGLDLRGLMALPPFRDDPEASRPDHRALAALRDQLVARTGLRLPELSTGMSGDFAVAVEEGSTRVRIGTALFGARGR